MRILVTGGYGYLGSSLANYLSKQGHIVSVASRNELPQIKALSKCESRKINWNSDKSISQVCKNIDMIIHAAGMNANECLKDPLLAESFNRDATSKILKMAVSQGCKYFIYLSTRSISIQFV